MDPLTVSLVVFAVVVSAAAFGIVQMAAPGAGSRELLRRWIDNNAAAIQTPLLLVLVLWLGIIFASFGLFSPRNGTVYSIIGLSALSLSMAVFVILELDQPFNGAIRISDAPLQVLLREIRR